MRPSERGLLQADFARRRIWTVDTDGTLRQEWLLIRRDSTQITYSLSNAPTTTPLLTMAQRKAQRYWIERTNQDAKSELGWDEVQAIKYRAWQHRVPPGRALTILASWFITETKLDLAQQFVRDPHLLEYYEVEVLPALCSQCAYLTPYCGRPCHFPTCHLKKRQNWSSNISIIAPVRANPGSEPLSAPEI